MGVDCPCVRQIIHWGIPEDVEMYIQESGRAGRDGESARAIIVKHPCDLNLKRTSQQMIDFCTSTAQCRRSILYSDFPRIVVISLMLAVYVVIDVLIYVCVDNVIIKWGCNKIHFCIIFCKILAFTTRWFRVWVDMVIVWYSWVQKWR